MHPLSPSVPAAPGITFVHEALNARFRGDEDLGGSNPEGDDAMTATNQDEELLTPSEVAKLFRVDPKTVTRWAKSGKLSSIRTLGGHRRYRASEVRLLLEGQQQPPIS
jgi:excisionase family DNA binding protein